MKKEEKESALGYRKMIARSTLLDLEILEINKEELTNIVNYVIGKDLDPTDAYLVVVEKT